MDLEMLLLAFAMFWKMSLAIKCYICVPERSESELNGPELCQYFDGSDAFVTDCPDSTVCVKKITTLAGLGDANSVTRGCARQLMSGYQEKIGRHWHLVNKIHEHEGYAEGCSETSGEFGTPAKTTNCFCRGDLCNTSVKIGGSLLLVILLSIAVL